MRPLARWAPFLFLIAPALFADADLRTAVIASDKVFRAGFHYANVRISVTNFGNETAKNVQFSVTSSVPISCLCQPEDIPPGQNRERFIQFDAPLTSGPMVFHATATSSTPDASPADNTVDVSVAVSADPDLNVSFGAPNLKPIDPGLAFPLRISVFNNAHSTAHDVELTLDLPANVGIRALPAGCTSAGARITCRASEVGPLSNPFFVPQLVAPDDLAGGTMTFTASVTSREPDFSATNNTSSATLQLYKTLAVTTTANGGAGSLRQAILDANAGCPEPVPCTIAFRIAEPATTPWKTIRVTSPLPLITVPRIRIDGATQTNFAGDANPDGPEIEITGSADAGDGIVVGDCINEIANLAVNGFSAGNAISVIDTARPPSCSNFGAANLHHLFIGTDPTGAEARPNLRGIGTSTRFGPNFGTAQAVTTITDSVISGNLRSGIFGMTGLLLVKRNRIGVKARSDEPLGNGNAGVYIGFGGYGSDVGTAFDAFSATQPGFDGNVIAFNGQMGVAVDRRAGDVAVTGNRMWSNGGLGIDVGLDGPSVETLRAPVLTLAHYDAAANQTAVEGELLGLANPFDGLQVDVYANDAGVDEGQRPLGAVRLTAVIPQHFRFTVAGDLTGQRITATSMRVFHNFSALDAQGVTSGYSTQTSEFSNAIEVTK